MTQNADMGTVVVRSHYNEDGSVKDVEIVEAPDRVAISLALIVQADPRFFTTTIRMGGSNPVEYRVVGLTDYAQYGYDVVVAERVAPNGSLETP